MSECVPRGLKPSRYTIVNMRVARLKPSRDTIMNVP